MTGPIWLCLALASATFDDPAAWVRKLGAEAFDDRVAASKALEAIGPDALPALRSAAASSTDERVRSRAVALVESIGRQAEVGRFARATLVRLDFVARPLGEIIATINERQDLGLILRLGPEVVNRGFHFDARVQPDGLAVLKARPITLEAAEPVPFWEAIDRICRAASLRYGTAADNRAGIRPMALMADRTGRGPVFDSGPYRVQMAGLKSAYERDFLAPADPAKPPGTGDLTLEMAILAEPGLWLYPNGPVVVEEAVDDQDRSLVKGASRPAESGATARSIRPISNPALLIRVVAGLVAPDPPGASIRRFRGKVPVLVVARSSDPIVIPLAGAGVVGKSVSNRDMRMVVDEVKLDPASAATVQLTFRFNGPGMNRFNQARPDFTAFDRDRLSDRLGLYDAAGRRIQASIGQTMRGADNGGFYDRYRLIVDPPANNGPANPAAGAANWPSPAELRYYGFVQSAIEIPFDFRDLPMP